VVVAVQGMLKKYSALSPSWLPSKIWHRNFIILHSAIEQSIIPNPYMMVMAGCKGSEELPTWI